MLLVTSIASDADLQRALAVRVRVFVEEQGVPPELEVDEFDVVGHPGAVHFLGTLDGEAVAAGRLLLANHEADGHDGGLPHIGRVAVLRELRGLGHGRTLMQAIEAEARARGYLGTTLAAQLHAMPFYARLGYVAHGPVFLDAGIEHRQMDLRWDQD